MMRVDCCTVHRDCKDYTRVLIATSTLNIINVAMDVLIDDAG